MSIARKLGGWFRFKDWGAPDPDSEKLHEAMHAARYSLALLTQTQAYHILEAAEAYCHFAGHPTDTKSVLDQLRLLRRAVKDHRAVAEKEPT